jgi:hypothetical protein
MGSNAGKFMDEFENAPADLLRHPTVVSGYPAVTGHAIIACRALAPRQTLMIDGVCHIFVDCSSAQARLTHTISARVPLVGAHWASNPSFGVGHDLHLSITRDTYALPIANWTQLDRHSPPLD